MIENVIEKIVTIVRGVAREKLIPLAQAMYDGGVTKLAKFYTEDR